MMFTMESKMMVTGNPAITTTNTNEGGTGYGKRRNKPQNLLVDR
jgi:hypothetical protein